MFESEFPSRGFRDTLVSMPEELPYEFLPVNLNSKTRPIAAAVLDRSDIERFHLQGISWSQQSDGRVKRNVFDQQRYEDTAQCRHTLEFLAVRLCAGAGRSACIRFGNGDPLDCRKANLYPESAPTRQKLTPGLVVARVPGWVEFVHALQADPVRRPDVPRGPRAKLTRAQVLELLNDTNPDKKGGSTDWARSKPVSYLLEHYIPEQFPGVRFSQNRLWEILTGHGLVVPGYDYSAHRRFFSRPGRRIALTDLSKADLPSSI